MAIEANSTLLNKVTQGDCLEVMREIADKSVDMILCDLPYGVTQNKWDSVIELQYLWNEYNRVIKDNGAILLFGQEPFSSTLRMSNTKNYRYDWVWEKSHARGFLNAWKQPLRKTELISVFYKKQCLYNPQITDKPAENIRPLSNRTKLSSNYGDFDLTTHKLPPDKSMPVNIIRFNTVQNGLHPTQKPVDLCEYLIRTYTNEGEVVLDNCLGSGTTAVAAINTNRQFIGIEREQEYVDIANKRIADVIVAKGTEAITHE